MTTFLARAVLALTLALTALSGAHAQSCTSWSSGGQTYTSCSNGQSCTSWSSGGQTYTSCS